MKEKKEQLDYWTGPLDSIYFEKKSGALTAKEIIEAYENEGKRVLREAGYPETIDELLKVEKKERQIRDILRMLSYFRGARLALKLAAEESFSADHALYADHACREMAFGVKAALAARLRPKEKFLDLGQKSSERGRTSRGKKEKHFGITDAQREERNRAMVEHFQELNANRKTPISVKSFCDIHASKYNLKSDTAARILRKLLP